MSSECSATDVAQFIVRPSATSIFRKSARFSADRSHLFFVLPFLAAAAATAAPHVRCTLGRKLLTGRRSACRVETPVVPRSRTLWEHINQESRWGRAEETLYKRHSWFYTYPHLARERRRSAPSRESRCPREVIFQHSRGGSAKYDQDA